MRRRELWLGRRPGAWAWLLHRLSGIALALYLIAHIMTISTARFEDGAAFDRIMRTFNNPVVKLLEILLIGAVIFHMANGFRVILLDFVLGIHHQKALLWAVMGVGAVILMAVAVTLVPFALASGAR